MRDKGSLDLGGIDWVTILLCIVLVVGGWLMIFAAGYDSESFTSIFDFKKTYGKQLIWMGGGAMLVLIAQLLESKFYQTFSIIFYGGTILLLLAVLFTKPINGATSWFDIGGFRFQPSEFAKTATCLSLASFLSSPEFHIQDNRSKLQAIGIVLLPMLLVLMQGDAGSTMVYLAFFIMLFRVGMDAWIYILGILVATVSIVTLTVDNDQIVFLLLFALGNLVLLRAWNSNFWLTVVYLVLTFISVLIFNQYIINLEAIPLDVTAIPLPNEAINFWQNMVLGSVILYILLFIGLVFLNLKKNNSLTILVLGGVIFASVIGLSIDYIEKNVLKPHQRDRIWVWLRPDKIDDPLGPLYNLDQSKYAIGSGGLSGKGFLQGERTKLDYVPEQSTDFIFCTVGEEWGFLGTSFFIAVFTLLLLRLVFIAERQRSLFSKYYAYGVACILFFHFFINIGMTMGVVPVIGIPLPFISYGGSSLLSFSILMGILLRLDSDRLSVFR